MGKVREIAEMTAWYLQEIRKDPKEEALAAIEAREALITLSKSRGATTLKELIKEVKRITKVSREEMILALDSIRGGIADPKNAWIQLLAEKAQLISNGKENFEAPENDDKESKSAAKDADQEAEEDDEVLEVDVQDTGAGEDSDEDDAGPRRGPGGGRGGARALQNVSADDGKYLPKSSACSIFTKRSSPNYLDGESQSRASSSRTASPMLSRTIERQANSIGRSSLDIQAGL